MASTTPREDGAPETGNEAGGATTPLQYDRRRFFQTLGLGAGAATVYGLGANTADGQIVRASEADLQALMEEEPYPDMSPEDYAKLLHDRSETDEQLVRQFLAVNHTEREAYVESLSGEKRTALFGALPMLALAENKEPAIEAAQGTTRRGLLAAGAAGLALFGMESAAQGAEKKSLIRTVAANNTSGKSAERARRLTPEQQYEADLRAKLTALAAQNDNISSVDIAMTYHDYDGGRRDFETRAEARARSDSAIADFNVIHNREGSTRMVEVRGQQVQLPTNHTEFQRKTEQPVRVGDRTIMGKMNYIISTTHLIRGDENPIGLKISKPLSMDPDIAERRFQAYKSRY